MMRNNDKKGNRKNQCVTWLPSPSTFDPNDIDITNLGADAERGDAPLPDALHDASGCGRAWKAKD